MKQRGAAHPNYRHQNQRLHCRCHPACRLDAADVQIGKPAEEQTRHRPFPESGKRRNVIRQIVHDQNAVETVQEKCSRPIPPARLETPEVSERRAHPAVESSLKGKNAVQLRRSQRHRNTPEQRDKRQKQNRDPRAGQRIDLFVAERSRRAVAVEHREQREESDLSENGRAGWVRLVRVRGWVHCEESSDRRAIIVNDGAPRKESRNKPSAGAIRKLTLGNSLTETTAYNTRVQPCRMNVNSSGRYLTNCTDAVPGGNVLDLNYGFNSGTANNGNVASIAATRTSDASHTSTYDPENRLIQVDGTPGTCSTATACYVYDALGRRAEKITSAGKYDYIYDLAGNVISEEYINVGGYTGWGVGHIYFNGSLLAEYTLGHSSSYTIFVHKDHLGSTRLVSNLNQSIADNLDYLPYGEQISGASVTTHKFTGDERDSETTLDHTWFRQYSPLLGRWITPDPFAGYIDNPQSLNRYSYVLNSPTTFTDPLGLVCRDEPNGPCNEGNSGGGGGSGSFG